MVPPTLSGDAIIFPFATRELIHNNQSLGKTRLEQRKGVWATDKGQQPVGQCKVTLPKPDLCTIDVMITMGYTAKFDGGKVRPNPPYTRFSFILNLASRRKL